MAQEYHSGWAEAQPQTQGTSEKIDNIFYKKVISQFGTPQCVVLDSGKVNNKWTHLLLKRYNNQKITVTPYYDTPNGVIARGHRPIANVLSNLTGCSDELKEMSSDHLPAVLSARGSLSDVWLDIRPSILCLVKMRCLR